MKSIAAFAPLVVALCAVYASPASSQLPFAPYHQGSAGLTPPTINATPRPAAPAAALYQLRDGRLVAGPVPRGLVAQPSPPAHDIGFVLYHSAAGDGVGARICIQNRGNVVSPPFTAVNLIEHSTDGISFAYREFPRYRLSVPAIHPTMSHCYNIGGRRGVFQRVSSRVEDSSDDFFRLERAEERSGLPRYPNALSQFIITPLR